MLADQSRTLKSRITNQAELAKTDSPITIDRLPKAKVQAQSLAPVGGAKSAPQPITLKPIADVAPQPVAEEPVVTEKIHQSQVVNTNIFVQAGAFSRFDNANKVRARLSPLGPVKLNQVLINGRDLYRVRVGPMENVGAADLMLASVSKAGYPESRIIVEK